MALLAGVGTFEEEIQSFFGNDDSRQSISVDGNSSDRLFVENDDAEFLNRIFRERSHEIAYCGYVIEVQKSWLEPWLADTINASPHSVQFSIANCKGDIETLKATIHTHPNGNPHLSERDRATLMTQRQNAMCIQSGQITAGIGDLTGSLSCYETAHLNGQVQIVELPVVLGDEPALGDTWS